MEITQESDAFKPHYLPYILEQTLSKYTFKKKKINPTFQSWIPVKLRPCGKNIEFITMKLV